MSDLAQIVDGVEPSEIVTEPVEAKVVEPVVEPEPTPEPEKAPEFKTTRTDEPQMVPVGVVTELRGEIRSLKAAMQPKEPAPDFFENPKAAVQHELRPALQAADDVKLNMSKFLAEREFGVDEVNSAMAYYDQHPEQTAAFGQHASPFHAAMDAYKQVQVATQIGNDPAAFEAKLRESITAEIKAEMVTSAAKEAAAQVAPSLANTIGTGGGPNKTWAGPTELTSLLGD